MENKKGEDNYDDKQTKQKITNIAAAFLFGISYDFPMGKGTRQKFFVIESCGGFFK